MDTITLYNGVRYAGIWILVYLIISMGFNINDVDSMIIAGIITILFIVFERMLMFKRKSDKIVARSVENFKRLEKFENNTNNVNNSNNSTMSVQPVQPVQPVQSTAPMKVTVNTSSTNAADPAMIEINGKMYRAVDIDTNGTGNASNVGNTGCAPCAASANANNVNNANNSTPGPTIQVTRSGMNGKLNTNPTMTMPYRENNTGTNHLDVDVRNVMSDSENYDNIHIMIDPFTKANHSKCGNTNNTNNTNTNVHNMNKKKWYEQDFNPRSYQGAENLDQIKTRNGTRDDMLVNNYRYSDFNRMPPSFNQNDFEYGYSFIPPKDWYPVPPYPPVCVSSTTCEAQPVYTDDTTMNLKRWHETQKFTQPDSINTEYIKNELNSY